jgi:hypothetical protein
VAKKKKKKTQATHQRKVIHGKHSLTYLNACYATARRILLALGEGESTFDIFTKRQKQDIFNIVMMPPHVLAMQGHKVPKKYIRYIQEGLIGHMKHSYFDEKYEITWMDIATVGHSLMLMFEVVRFMESLSAPQREVAERLRKIFEDEDIFGQTRFFIAGNVRMSLLILSQPNFRIYGQEYDQTTFQPVIRVMVHECQPLRFKYHNIERTAFRVAMGQTLGIPYMGATIAISKIFSHKKRHDRMLDIYIQSHAIHRFKERIDTLHPILRNEYFVLSLMVVQKVVRGPDGMQLIACVTPLKGEDKIIGYFAFTIDGENLLVLTLLPLLSCNVPEGHVLYERLHLSQEDLKYLGMDKLSFFYDVDIEQIPALKQVLFDELHLDYVHDLPNSFQKKDEPFNEKRTLFVKNFFQKLEEQNLDNNAKITDVIGLDY